MLGKRISVFGGFISATGSSTEDGFISGTGSSAARKSTTDYFTPIDQPFTDFEVLRELLKRSKKPEMQ